MNFENYQILHDRVTAMRGAIGTKIAVQTAGLKDALLSEFFRSARRGGDMSIDKLTAIARASFRIKKTDAAKLTSIIESGMDELAIARRAVLDKAGIGAPPLDYEELMAAYRVDLPQVSASARKQAVNTWRRTIARGKSFRDMERELTESGIVDVHARTEANTALAQFDNDYTVSLAREAGIEKFRFTGPKAQRFFCVRLMELDEVYTVEEIERMDNGQGLPVLTSCGGWYCSHTWTPDPFAK